MREFFEFLRARLPELYEEWRQARPGSRDLPNGR